MLQSEVQLVPGAEGNYLMGSVRYATPTEPEPESGRRPSQGVTWGGGDTASTSGGLMPPAKL